MFIPWPSIESFYNVRKTVARYPELLNGSNKVTYKAKLKLHGTNSGIQCHADGTLVAQSRTKNLLAGHDNAGFAKWVEETSVQWKSLSRDHGIILVYGEWIGKGINSGAAACLVPQKSFCVFATSPLSDSNYLTVDPVVLNKVVKGIQKTYVLPWHQNLEIEIDWSKSAEELERVASKLNEKVLEVEACDPWIKETFGIEGVGEGLVFYPVSKLHQGRKCFSDLAFKAKGEKHQVVKTKVPVQVDSETVNSINEFVDLFLTEGRMNQGAVSVNNGSLEFEKKNIGLFLGWISKDIEKESKEELKVSGFEWKPIAKVLAERARAWYLKKS